MKPIKLSSIVFVVIGLVVLAGCSTSANSPDVSSAIRNDLDHAGLKDVSVKQDRDKGVVTLTGSPTLKAAEATTGTGLMVGASGAGWVKFAVVVVVLRSLSALSGSELSENGSGMLEISP